MLCSGQANNFYRVLIKKRVPFPRFGPAPEREEFLFVLRKHTLYSALIYYAEEQKQAEKIFA